MARKIGYNAFNWCKNTVKAQYDAPKLKGKGFKQERVKRESPTAIL